MSTTTTITSWTSAITAIVAVITSLVTLGEKAWPQIKSLAETLATVINNAVSGTEITEEALSEIRARVDAVYTADMALDKEKFGIDDAATQETTDETESQ